MPRQSMKTMNEVIRRFDFEGGLDIGDLLPRLGSWNACGTMILRPYRGADDSVLLRFLGRRVGPPPPAVSQATIQHPFRALAQISISL